MNPKELAAFVWGVDAAHVLAASFGPDLGLVAVIDYGIEGGKKFVLTPDASASVWGRMVGIVENEELRGTFGSDGVAITGAEFDAALLDAVEHVLTPAAVHEKSKKKQKKHKG